MNAQHLPEPPRPWPAPRRRRPATLTAATLRRWRAAGLDPATVIAALVEVTR